MAGRRGAGSGALSSVVEPSRGGVRHHDIAPDGRRQFFLRHQPGEAVISLGEIPDFPRDFPSETRS
jgi:hypothetical protein